jgi:hypothetical protein
LGRTPGNRFAALAGSMLLCIGGGMGIALTVER